MSHIPILGAVQRDARFDNSAPRLRTRSLFCLRAHDGTLLPLNEGMSVEYRPRTGPATIYASNGDSGLLGAAMPAFSHADWDGDGVREEQVLELSDEEALRYYDATLEELQLPVGALVGRHDWIERGAANIPDAPYWSLTNDSYTGAWLAMRGTGDGAVALLHYNPSIGTVSTEMSVSNGQRCSMRYLLNPDGSVRFGLVKNGGSEVMSVASDPLEFAAAWGEGSGVKLRLNELGDSLRGVQAFRYHTMFRGTATRQQLLEVL